MAQKIIEGDNDSCQHVHLIYFEPLIFRFEILFSCSFAEVAT